MFFTDKKRKKNLIFSLFALAFFCGVVFLAQIHVIHAGLFADTAADVAAYPFKVLLYGIFVFFGWMTSVAVTLFGWYIDPDTMGLLNRNSVYEMWQFIRDFFNLFFILTLLYVAFKIVFQIDKDFKKTLLSLVLAALYINFSFPVTRFLIDATNVPMYFFANQMLTDPSKPGESFGTALRASQLKEILIPEAQSLGATAVSRLLTADIFLFLFSVTLLVLAILFANRVIFLIILLIFSPIGFAAYVIPGMGDWSKKWWEHFWKNALFGPAAMLGLLIATRFFAEISQDQTRGMVMGVAAQTSTGSDMGFIASMTLFVVPIIMLWMVMALGNTMSIAGASGLISMGQNFSKWAGKAPFRATWAGMKWGGRKLDTHVLAKRGLSPKAWIGGIKGYFETQGHEDQLPIDLATGRMHNKMNSFMSKALPWVHKDNVDYEFLKEQQQIRKEEAELKERSGGTINENMGRVALEEGVKEHDRNKLLASLYTLARTNGLDNVVGDFWHQYIDKKDANGDPFLKDVETLADGTKVIDISKNHDAVLQAMMEGVGIDRQTQLKHVYNFGELAKVSGDEVFAERATPDLKKGTFMPVDGKEHAKAAVTQMLKMRTQGLLDAMHGRVHAEQQVVVAPDGTISRQWGDLHDLGEEWASRVSENVVNQMTRMKPEAVAAYKSLWERATSSDPEVRKTVTRFITAYNKKDNVSYRRFVLKGIGILDKGTEGNPQADPKDDKDPSGRYKVAL